MKYLKLDWNGFDKCFEKAENNAQKALNNIMVGFEEDLLQTAIKMEARQLYAANFDARKYSGNSVKYELFYNWYVNTGRLCVISRMFTRPRMKRLQNYEERLMFSKREIKWLRKFIKNGYRKIKRKIYKFKSKSY